MRCVLRSRKKLPVGLTRPGRPVNRLSAVNFHISVTPASDVRLIYTSSESLRRKKCSTPGWSTQRAEQSRCTVVACVAPKQAHTTVGMYVTHLCMSDASKNKGKRAQWSKVTRIQGFVWKNDDRSVNVVRSNPSERDLGHSVSCLQWGWGGFPFNGMVLSLGDLVDEHLLTLICRCCGSFWSTCPSCEPHLQAWWILSAGTSSSKRHCDSPSSASAFATIWPGSSVVCHNGLACGTLTNTTPNNSMLRTQKI